MKRTLKRLVREERASAQIVEYSIILPICLLILGFLFMAGFYLNQKAVLDSAVNRGVLVARKMYCDANADTVLNLGDQEGSHQVGVSINQNGLTSDSYKSDPYRYLRFTSKFDKIYSAVERKITNSVKTSQLVAADSKLSDLKIEMPDKFKGFIVYKMTVSVRQEFYNPFIPPLLGSKAKSLFSIESSATASVMNSVELLRTTDLVNDVVERYSGKEAGTWVRDLMGKITSFMDKTDEKK